MTNSFAGSPVVLARMAETPERGKRSSGRRAPGGGIDPGALLFAVGIVVILISFAQRAHFGAEGASQVAATSANEFPPLEFALGM